MPSDSVLNGTTTSPRWLSTSMRLPAAPHSSVSSCSWRTSMDRPGTSWHSTRLMVATVACTAWNTSAETTVVLSTDSVTSRNMGDEDGLSGAHGPCMLSGAERVNTLNASTALRCVLHTTSLSLANVAASVTQSISGTSVPAYASPAERESLPAARRAS